MGMETGTVFMSREEMNARMDAEVEDCRKALGEMVKDKLLNSIAWSVVELIMSDPNMRDAFNRAVLSWMESEAEERAERAAIGKPKGDA